MQDKLLIEAYEHMLAIHECSVDDILETPELREAFLREARRLLGDLPERELLHRLTYLRKRSRLRRSRGSSAV